MNLDRLYAELEYVWVCWQNATLVKKWRVDNPRESAMLDAWVNAHERRGDAPTLLTATGQALLQTFQVLEELRAEMRIREGGGGEFGGDGLS